MPTVSLDIGHGINTPGKRVTRNGKVYKEHNFNSKLALELEKLLKANGIDTLMYQKAFSNEIGLTQRTNYYNQQGIDLVWSIHANAGGGNGRCAFYWHTSENSKHAARLFIDEVKEAGYSTHGNGLHASEPGSWTNLHICRETKAPAVLTENGFMDSDSDFQLIFGDKQDSYIKAMAVAHARAICRYFGIDFKGGITVAKTNNDQPSKWAESSWEEATKNGYFDGTRPKDNITREEVAAVVNRLRDNLLGEIRK